MRDNAFPTLWTIEVLPHVWGPPDSHGNRTEGWADPITYDVYGWGAPPYRVLPSDEPYEEPGRDEIISSLQVFAPSDVVVKPFDRIIVGGVLYDVIGEPGDYAHGPFGWNPGTRISAKRVEG